MGILPMSSTGILPVGTAVCRAKMALPRTGRMPVPRGKAFFNKLLWNQQGLEAPLVLHVVEHLLPFCERRAVRDE